jgi:hypothetical protein
MHHDQHAVGLRQPIVGGALDARRQRERQRLQGPGTGAERNEPCAFEAGVARATGAVTL